MKNIDWTSTQRIHVTQMTIFHMVVLLARQLRKSHTQKCTCSSLWLDLQRCQRRLPVTLSILSNDHALHKSANPWVASTNWNEEKKSGRPNPTTWKDPTCSIVCNEQPAMWCINYKMRDHSRWLHDRHNCEQTKVSVGPVSAKDRSTRFRVPGISPSESLHHSP